ncbi:MAG: hypothetical protein AAB522_02565 [Patescibacteria group bacterium]
MAVLRIFVLDGNEEFDPEYESTIKVIAAKNKREAQNYAVENDFEHWRDVPCLEIGIATSNIKPGVIISDKSY